jgi:hypothetical protein
MPTIEELLTFNEWYDNSRISAIRGCKRKAYLSLIGPPNYAPLARPVGDGANFGTAFHAATNKYYELWGTDETDRRGEAALVFRDEWQKFFPTDGMQPKHNFTNGLAILSDYFETHFAEDGSYRPIKGELGFCVKLQPPDSPPFLYIGRVDGVFERIYDNTVWIRELKTTSKSAKDRLEALKFSHQTLGYIYCLRQGNPNLAIRGAMPEVVLIAAQKREAIRTCYDIAFRETESWKNQLFETVAEWREKARRACRLSQSQAILDIYYQDTERCFDYGKCAFYDICDYGLDNALLDDFEENTWNPLTEGRKINLEIF